MRVLRTIQRTSIQICRKRRVSEWSFVRQALPEAYLTTRLLVHNRVQVVRLLSVFAKGPLGGHSSNLRLYCYPWNYL